MLLVAIVGIYVLLATIDNLPWARPAVTLLFGVVLLFSFRASGLASSRHRTLMVAVLAALLITAALAAWVPSAHRWGLWSWSVLCMCSIGFILRRLVAHLEITVHTLAGVVCVYLLVGLTFATIYHGLDEAIEGGFFVQPGPHPPVDFSYFSVTVLTTLGFGDLTPRADIGKALVTMEALFGQVFLVTVVAAVVGNLGRSRRPRTDRNEANDSAGPTDPS